MSLLPVGMLCDQLPALLHPALFTKTGWTASLQTIIYINPVSLKWLLARVTAIADK